MIVELVTCLLPLVSTLYGADGRDTNPLIYNKNNPLNVPDDKVLFPRYGSVFDVYSIEGDREVKNLRVPLIEYGNVRVPTEGSAPFLPIYFNLVKNDQNLGQFVLVDNNLTKINDGRDLTADYPAGNSTSPREVYIGAGDGIYSYNIDSTSLTKYGELTEDILAIEKVSGEDIFYILTADHKIYKVIERGTTKTRVEGIEYAKDFVLNFEGDIYYLDEDNKPCYLAKGSAVAYKHEEFNFEVKNAILCNPGYGWSIGKTDDDILFVVDGVAYMLVKDKSFPAPDSARVPGLTAFSVEFVFVHYYGVGSNIYQHALLDNKKSTSGTKKDSNK